MNRLTARWHSWFELGPIPLPHHYLMTSHWLPKYAKRGIFKKSFDHGFSSEICATYTSFITGQDSRAHENDFASRKELSCLIADQIGKYSCPPAKTTSPTEVSIWLHLFSE